MNGPRPLMFIGLDSAEPKLLRRWMASGDLPVLARLAERSVVGETTVPPGFGNGTLWPSVFTGVNPARHGRMWFQQIVPGTYRVEAFDDDEGFGARPLWEAFSAAGRRCAVVDVVRAPLSRSINGIHVCDWFTHDRNSPPRSEPPAELERIIRAYGDDPFGGHVDRPDMGAEGFASLRRGLVDRIGVKTRCMLDLLGRSPWDFFMTVYADPHDIGHMCWHLHEEDHPLHDASLRQRLGDPIKAVYVALDRAVGDLLAAAPAEATVIVFGGPGMQRFASASHLLDRILTRLEPGRGGQRAAVRHRLKALWRDALPQRLRTALKGASNRVGAAMREAEQARRTCFAVPNNDEYGAIRFNVVGREPNGRVQPGGEYEALCERISEELLKVVDLDTGKPIVKTMIRVSDVYQGPYRDRLPDLVAIWALENSAEAVGSPSIGEIRGRHSTFRTGDHSDRCMFYVSGGGLAPGELPEPVCYLDFAATLPALVGVPVAGLDGRPIPRMLPAASAAA